MNSIPIIYENQEIIIINKPQGVAVQGGQNIAHPLDKELPLQLGFPIYLVHRLDQETSGLLIVAKTPQAANKWTKLIGEKSVKKEYDALCVGCPKKMQGEFKSSINDRGVEKSALTYYEVVKSYQVDSVKNDDSTKDENEKKSDGAPLQSEKITLSQIHLTLGTGRMHQIRIHLAKAGFPIAGDDKYGNFKVNKMLKKCAGIKRLKLVSSRLTIPVNGKMMTFEVAPDF